METLTYPVAETPTDPSRMPTFPLLVPLLPASLGGGPVQHPRAGVWPHPAVWHSKGTPLPQSHGPQPPKSPKKKAEQFSWL